MPLSLFKYNPCHDPGLISYHRTHKLPGGIDVRHVRYVSCVGEIAVDGYAGDIHRAGRHVGIVAIADLDAVPHTVASGGNDFYAERFICEFADNIENFAAVDDSAVIKRELAVGHLLIHAGDLIARASGCLNALIVEKKH